MTYTKLRLITCHSGRTIYREETVIGKEAIDDHLTISSQAPDNPEFPCDYFATGVNASEFVGDRSSVA